MGVAGVRYLIFGLDPHLSIKKPIWCQVTENMRGSFNAQSLELSGEGLSEEAAMADLVDNIQKRFVLLIVSENLTKDERHLLKGMKKYIRYMGHGIKSWRRDD